MKASILVSLVCVFIAGVIFGIWLDWRAPKHREFTYQLQEWPAANLEVHELDTVRLVGADWTMDGLKMNFGGLSPCINQQPSNPCVIKPKVMNGPYPFGCDSGGNGKACSDPGIQPRSNPPLQATAFFKTLAQDLGIAGAQNAPAETGEPGSAQSPPPTPPPPPDPVMAYVGCLDGKTELHDQKLEPLTSFTAQVNQTVFWISPSFALNTSNFPSGLCTGTNPGGNNLQGSAKCIVQMGGQQNLAYTATALTTPNCSATTFYLTTTAAPKK